MLWKLAFVNPLRRCGVADLHVRTQGQDRRQMEYIAKAFEFVEDGDHRVAAVNLQGQGLDDAWTALLGSTLEASHTVRTVMLNR